MPSLGLFYSLFAFLRELFFGKDVERRKVGLLRKIVLYSVFIGLSGSLWLNKHLINRTFELNSRLSEYKLKVDVLKDYKLKTDNCEIQLRTAKEYVNRCLNK